MRSPRFWTRVLKIMMKRPVGVGERMPAVKAEPQKVSA